VLTLVVLTAAVLAAALVVSLAVALVFALQTRRFLAETAAALGAVEPGSRRLADRLEQVHQSVRSAADVLGTGGR
jgi:hypothetical protein